MTSRRSRTSCWRSGLRPKDDPAYYRRDIARYFQVTPADVARVAAKYLTPDRVVLEVVPMKPGEPKAKAVQVGPNESAAGEVEVADRSPAEGPDWSKMPGASEAGAFKPPAILRKTLKNGVDVVHRPQRPCRSSPQAAGSSPLARRTTPRGKAGLELTATLLTKGTKEANELAEGS